ncbi:MAG: hypothetical protein GYB68_01430 [Chloroflexi bacterium]|nr:hypothetical protein [Chloroflexota bacterium]
MKRWYLLGLLMALTLFACSPPSIHRHPTQAMPTAEASEAIGPDAAAPLDQAAGTASPAAPEPDLAPLTVQPTSPVLLTDTRIFDAEEVSNESFEFSAGAGRVIRIDAQVIEGTLDYQLILRNDSDVVLARIPAGELGNARLNEFNIPRDGRYQLEVSAQSGRGALQVTIEMIDSATGGGILQGFEIAEAAVLGQSNVFHTYRFTLREGDIISIGAISDAYAEPDTAMLLFGPDGGLVAEAQDREAPVDLDAVLPAFEVPQSGTYVAIVSATDDTMGPYTFVVNPVDEADLLPPTEPDVQVGNAYRVGFAAEDPLLVTFDAQLGDALAIDVFDLTEDFAPGLYLYAPGGQTLAFVVGNPDLPGQPVRIDEIQLPFSGRYTLEIRPNVDGQASLQISSLNDQISGGGFYFDANSFATSATIEAPRVFHVYQVNASAGDLISVELSSSTLTGELNLAMALLDPSGNQLVFVDDTPTSSDPSLQLYQIQATGSYVLVVYSLTIGTGSYDISYERR